MDENDVIYKKQMQEISDIVAQTGQLLPAFNKAYAMGNIGLFRDFIKKHSLQETFVQNSLADLISSSYNGEQKKCFIKIAEQEGLSYLTKVYGNEFGEKLQTFYESRKIGITDIDAISNINKSNNIKKQTNIMMKILNLYEQDNLEIGIHRTGGNCNGETLNQEGINLTGNISSGVVNQKYSNIIDRLEDNISFANAPGLLLSQIAYGGDYKNYTNEEFVDIAIVAIPKDKIENNNVTIKNKKSPTKFNLNPKYIHGYVTVNSRDCTLEDYVENPRYFSKTNLAKNILAKTIEDSKTKTKFSGIQQIISNIKNKIQDKIKSKDKKTGVNYGEYGDR